MNKSKSVFFINVGKIVFWIYETEQKFLCLKKNLLYTELKNGVHRRDTLHRNLADLRMNSAQWFA